MKSNTEMMADIVAHVGDVEARQMVLSAYNTELISNRLGRLEKQQSTSHLRKVGKTDFLNLALVRVHEVVTLGH